MHSAPYSIRLATPKDARQMLDIYGPVVLGTAISFEVETPSEQEFRRRIAETLQRLPWLVCLCQNRVAGYAYAAPFRNRAGYRWSVEVSVYVDEEFRGRGVASALYTSLLEGLRILGYFNAYAGISLPNPASVNLHERMGFKPVGVFPSAGFKLGRWHDVGFWRLTLQEHTAEPPPPKSLEYLASSPQWAQCLKAPAAAHRRQLTYSNAFWVNSARQIPCLTDDFP